MKKLLSIMAVFVISLLAVSLVSATSSTLGGTLEGLNHPQSTVTVEVNDEVLSSVNGGNLLVVEEGENLDIEVTLRNSGAVDATGIEVVARLSGYEYSDSVDLEDSTALFDVNAGTRKKVNLELTMPRDIDNGLNTLRVMVLDRNSNAIVNEYELEVESPRNSVDIEDVTFSPGNTVKAGRSLLASVLVENFGDRTEDDVQVTVEIPTLGVQATDYIETLGAGDSEDVSGDYEGGLLLHIPANAEAGDYEVLVTVKYDNGRDSITKAYTVTVLGSNSQSVEQLTVVVSPESQAVAAGRTAVYGVALSNDGTSSKAYTLSVVTGDWATASLSENLVVLAPGASSVVYVEVTADANAANGEHVASLAVKAGDEVLETITLKADVASSGVANGNVDLRNGLEIALIVLVVVLVIVGLIVGFSRLRKDEEDDQTYY